MVFASAIGTPLDAANVRREFRKMPADLVTAGLVAVWGYERAQSRFLVATAQMTSPSHRKSWEASRLRAV